MSKAPSFWVTDRGIQTTQEKLKCLLRVTHINSSQSFPIANHQRNGRHVSSTFSPPQFILSENDLKQTKNLLLNEFDDLKICVNIKDVSIMFH